MDGSVRAPNPALEFRVDTAVITPSMMEALMQGQQVAVRIRGRIYHINLRPQYMADVTPGNDHPGNPVSSVHKNPVEAVKNALGGASQQEASTTAPMTSEIYVATDTELVDAGYGHGV